MIQKDIHIRECKPVGPLEFTLFAIAEEVTAARKKFPTNEDKLAALTEEVGELANALLEDKYGNGTPEHVRSEALQVAAMAIRIYEEGDAGFPYDPAAMTAADPTPALHAE